MALADVNGQKLYFEDSGGDGLPVVFAHGFLMDHEMFAAQVAALSPAYRVITWDARGFGDTQFDGKPFTFWDSANDVLGLLDHLGIERAVIAGMSQGGFAGMRVALVAPERVLGLILIDTRPGVEGPEEREGYVAMFDAWEQMGPTDHITDLLAQIIVGDPAHNNRWIAKWKARPKEFIVEPGRTSMAREDLTPRLGEIQCPTLVIHGVEDPAFPMDDARTITDGISNARLVEVPGGHAACMTHPDAVNAAILRFLAELDQAS